MSYETTTDYEKDFEESMWAQLRRKITQVNVMKAIVSG